MMKFIRDNSLTSDSSKSSFTSMNSMELEAPTESTHKVASSFLVKNKKPRASGVRFDLEISSSQREIPSYDDENEFSKSLLYYSHDEIQIMKERMNQDIKSFVASSKTVKCQQTLHRVLRHCEDATSGQHSYKHLVIQQKLCKKYELFGDHMIGLERYILGESALGKQQKILASAKAGAFHAIDDITFSSRTFASELAAAQAYALTSVTAADRQSKAHQKKGGRMKVSLFDIFKSMRKDDMMLDAQNQCAPPA